MEEQEIVSRNFIEQIIDKDLEEGKYEKIVTRFPPEPNAYWTCKVHFVKLRTGTGISRTV